LGLIGVRLDNWVYRDIEKASWLASLASITLGTTYHVMLRGNGGQDIFFSPSDLYRLYLLLQEGIEKYGQKPPLTRLAFYFL
jgi:hypothetical protein